MGKSRSLWLAIFLTLLVLTGNSLPAGAANGDVINQNTQKIYPISNGDPQIVAELIADLRANPKDKYLKEVDSSYVDPNAMVQAENTAVLNRLRSSGVDLKNRDNLVQYIRANLIDLVNTINQAKQAVPRINVNIDKYQVAGEPASGPTAGTEKSIKSINVARIQALNMYTVMAEVSDKVVTVKINDMPMNYEQGNRFSLATTTLSPGANITITAYDRSGTLLETREQAVL